MSSSSSKMVIYAALIGNALVACAKFIAAGISGSSAMLSEGIHSVVDTGNQGLLLYGLARSKKPADEDFPFGYGKEVYFWSFVVAILIFSLGAGISIYEGIHHISHPAVLSDPTINYIVLSLALLFEGAAWYFAWRQFQKGMGRRSFMESVKREKDPSTFLVLFEDSAAMLGLLIALFGIMLSQYTGNMVYDGAASILIGIILAGTAWWLALETKGLLIGESANSEVNQLIKRLTRKQDGVEHVNEVLTLHMGPEYILVTISVDFRNDINANEMEKTIVRLDQLIKSKLENVKRVYVEAEARSGFKRH